MASSCSNCGALASNSVCSGCYTTFYCNAVCQATHWKADHKHICKPADSVFWTLSQARAFVKKIFPDEPPGNFEDNIYRLANSIWVTPEELKSFVDPCSFATRAGLTMEETEQLVPPAVQAEMNEILKSINSCERCGRHCAPGAYCGATRHIYGWELVD
jgi:hypothetical protein